MNHPMRELTAVDTPPAQDGPKTALRAPYFMLVLALIGIADAFYVARGSYTGQALWCPIIEGCNIVAQSPYARIFGVPLSYFGLVFYLYLFGLAALLVFDPFARGLRLGARVYAALGVAYSIYGMYLQLGAIRAICIYCLISAVMTVLLLIAASWHFKATRIPAASDRPVRNRTRLPARA